MDKEIFLNLYKSIVRPHLEYATSIWTPMYKKRYDSNRKRITQSHQVSQEPKKQNILGKMKILGFKTTVTSSVKGRQFSVINNSELD